MRATDAYTQRMLSAFELGSTPVVTLRRIEREGNRSYDNLRIAWRWLADEIGVELLANLDADAVARRDWLTRVVALHDARRASAGYLIATGFNAAAPLHPVISEHDDHYVKASIGGFNLCFDHPTFATVVEPALHSPGWDWDVVRNLVRVGGRLVCTRPSVVQHIGRVGIYSSPLHSHDRAVDYWGTNRVARTVAGASHELRRRTSTARTRARVRLGRLPGTER